MHCRVPQLLPLWIDDEAAGLVGEQETDARLARQENGSRVTLGKRMVGPMPLLIRPATVEDVPQILAFIQALAEYEQLLPEVAATADRLRTTLFPVEGRPAAECLLAVFDGKPAGFALFFPNYSTFLAQPGLYLEDLFVTPELRGRGIGRALLLHLAQLANQRGCGRMEWAVLDWNVRAIAFYESLGARRLREWQICRLAGAALEHAASR